MSKDNSEPAFPAPEASMEHYGKSDGYTGMTLRDYFAAKAMQAMINTAGAPCLFGLDDAEHHTAQAAYKMADAMIEARNQ